MKKIILTIVLTLGALQANTAVHYDTQDTTVHYDTQETKSPISKPNHPNTDIH
ncbi:MAG: hypothetical protein KAR81_08175 [Sulfurimonas sp.]|nr:hypothetical protein [Sulfurimonas sp.]MCK4975217.1 hypothetical protein [Sulfurimonas sp.]